MEPILSVRELTKTFSRPGQGKLTAVNGVSFDLRPGCRNLTIELDWDLLQFSDLISCIVR